MAGRRLIVWAFFILGSIPDSSLYAQGFVEHLEPPVLERGKTTRLRVIGANLGKALDLWTSLPNGAIKANPVGTPTANQAEFDVVVAAHAPVGVAGLRLATADGLANAVLFLIEDLPVRPAPLIAEVNKVALPASLWGRVREAAVDRFAIDVLAGQKVSFEAVANRLGKDVDPLITIRDSQGRFVLERDNDPGLYFDCRFEHTFAAAGTYTVEIRDARFHGSEHGFYVLRMGRFWAGRVGLPSAVTLGKRTPMILPDGEGTSPVLEIPPTKTGLFFGNLRRPQDQGSVWVPLEAVASEVTVHRDQGTPAKVPGILCGVLFTPGEKNLFRLELGKGQKIQVRGEARAFNSPADLELAITDAAGKELRRAGQNPQEEIVLDFAANNPGIYFLSVRDAHREGGPSFAYRLEIRTGQPQVQVLAEVEGLNLPRGTYQPMPLTVTRTDYAGPIALTLVGVPAGVTLIPDFLEAGQNAVVCKLSAGPEAPLGLYTLQILAQPTESPDAPAQWIRTKPLIDRQIINVDLIPHALREDQRRLPPSLADRFALQITPQAGFEIELPEALVTLGRYQHADFPIVTTRRPGFTGPLTFSAKGGQIANKEEGRTRVYAEFPEAQPERLQVTGSIHSRILTNLLKHRVELTAVGIDQGRSVSLTRTFDLEIRSAFTVSADPPTQKLEPGQTARVRLNVDRMKTFNDEVKIQLSAANGLDLPDRVVILKGQTGIDLEIKVDSSRQPGKVNINLLSTGLVSGFEEELRGGRLEIEISRPPAPKK